MRSLVMDGIEDYARAHTTKVHELYDRLREETYAHVRSPQMQVGHLEGRVLKMIVQLLDAKKIVEVGTFTGYSSLSLAEGLTGDGEVHTFDIDPVATDVARRFWKEAPWGSRIHLHLGDARANVPTFAASYGPIDLAFIDADKGGYVTYWNALVAALRPGGVILVDNVLWSGRVLDPQGGDDDAIVAFNEHAMQDERVEQVMLTVRDGLLMARKR